MKLSTVLFIAMQMTLVLSMKTGTPEDSDAPDDGRGTIAAPELTLDKKLVPRACRYGKSYGCSKARNGSYRCWKKCGGAGEWCWLATQGGSGPWISCGTDEQCSPDSLAALEAGCGKGDCRDCGCSC